jgi:hypothetical protein
VNCSNCGAEIDMATRPRDDSRASGKRRPRRTRAVLISGIVAALAVGTAIGAILVDANRNHEISTLQSTVTSRDKSRATQVENLHKLDAVVSSVKMNDLLSVRPTTPIAIPTNVTSCYAFPHEFCDGGPRYATFQCSSAGCSETLQGIRIPLKWSAAQRAFVGSGPDPHGILCTPAGLPPVAVKSIVSASVKVTRVRFEAGHWRPDAVTLSVGLVSPKGGGCDTGFVTWEGSSQP